MKDKNTIHLLVLGAPRSGTTLLSAMLGCHPDIAILNDDLSCAEFNLLAKRVRGNKLCVPNEIELTHSRFMKLCDTTVTRSQQFINRINRRIGKSTSVPRGPKSRLSIRGYEMVAQNLKIIGIIRSPADVVKSIVSRGRQTEKTANHRWKRSIEVLFELSQDRKPETELLIVQYDQLVTSPGPTIKRCLSALDCEYTGAVLDGHLHTGQYQAVQGIDKGKSSSGFEEDLLYPLLAEDQKLKDKYAYLVRASLLGHLDCRDQSGVPQNHRTDTHAAK